MLTHSGANPSGLKIVFPEDTTMATILGIGQKTTTQKGKPTIR